MHFISFNLFRIWEVIKASFIVHILSIVPWSLISYETYRIHSGRAGIRICRGFFPPVLVFTNQIVVRSPRDYRRFPAVHFHRSLWKWTVLLCFFKKISQYTYLSCKTEYVESLWTCIWLSLPGLSGERGTCPCFQCLSKSFSWAPWATTVVSSIVCFCF